MKHSTKIALAVAFSVLSFHPMEVYAGDGEFDTRVHVALVREGVRFRHDEDGDFLATFETGDGRNQLVVVNSETKKEGEYEFREVWSMAYKGEPLREGKLEELLVENASMKIGGWRIQQGDKWLVAYSIRIAADADGPTIKTAMLLCAIMADGKEKDWLRTDKL